MELDRWGFIGKCTGSDNFFKLSFFLSLSIVSSYCFKLFPQGACQNSNSFSSYIKLKLLIAIDDDKSRARKLSTFVYIFFHKV